MLINGRFAHFHTYDILTIYDMLENSNALFVKTAFISIQRVECKSNIIYALRFFIWADLELFKRSDILPLLKAMWRPLDF